MHCVKPTLYLIPYPDAHYLRNVTQHHSYTDFNTFDKSVKNMRYKPIILISRRIMAQK